MKKLFLALFLLYFLNLNCVKKIDELPYNPLDDPNAEFVKITDYNYDSFGKVTFFFEINLDLENNSAVTGIAIFKDGNLRALLTDLSRRSFVESNLPLNATVCFEVALASGEDEFREVVTLFVYKPKVYL